MPRYGLRLTSGQTLYVKHDAPNLREFCQYLNGRHSSYVPFDGIEDFGTVYVPSLFGEGLAESQGYRETGWKVINRDHVEAITGPQEVIKS